MEYLKGQGYLIFDTNYRCPYGEIDLICQDTDGTIVFVEVKARSNQRFGHASESLTALKCQKIRKTSQFYIVEKRFCSQQAFRYDVIVFQNNQMEHIVNAF